jgi:hypothetical protein
MLVAPGLIALRIHWCGREIRRENLKYLICDYLIYDFLITLIGFAPLFLTHSDDPARFFNQSFGFVFKYSCVVLVAAVALPLAWKYRRKIMVWGKIKWREHKTDDFLK